MKKLLFLFNPVAGKAQIASNVYIIIEYYTQEGYLVTACPTGQEELIDEIFMEHSGDFNKVVCAGGDGTLNRILSLCMKYHCQIPLGYLPTGSTNDVAKTLGYSFSLEQDLHTSCYGVERRIDIGQFNNQFFAYVAAFGSIAEASYTTSQQSKNMLGHLAYILNGIQRVTDLKPYQLKIEYEDTVIEGEFCIGLIMNSFSIGGFRNPVSEFVVLDDGLFEAVFIRVPRNLMELQAVIKGLLGQRFDSELIAYIQTGELKIYSEPINWILDGEFGGKVEVADIKNCQKAVRIMTNI